MLPSLRRAALVALLTPLLLGPGVSAGRADPVAPPVPVEPVECAVAPRLPEELRELALADFRDVTAGRGTVPAPGATSATAPLRLREPPDPADLADISAVAAVFIACTNAGNVPALVALLTDEAAEPVLGARVRARQRTIGGTPDPTALDPAVVDAYLASLAVPVPVPADARQTVLEIRDAHTLPDGRVAATVVTAAARWAPETAKQRSWFRPVDGRWLLDVASPDPGRAVAIPAATGGGTPSTLPTPADPAECTVERLSAAKMRALLDAGLASLAVARERTGGPSVPVSPAAATPPHAVPAEPAVVAAITAAAHDSAACTNAGDLPAQLALMTEETAAPYLASLALFSLGEGDGTPAPASVDDAARDAVIADLAVPNPRGPSDQEALVGVRDARLLPDGRVRATVVRMTARTAPETFEGMVDFCYEEGRYRWHVAAPRSCGAPGERAATPTASAPNGVPVVLSPGHAPGSAPPAVRSAIP